jgi:hypothetical protein
MLETLGTWLGDLFRSKIEKVLKVMKQHILAHDNCNFPFGMHRNMSSVITMVFSSMHLTDLDLFGPGLCEGLCPKCFGFSHEWRA